MRRCRLFLIGGLAVIAAGNHASATPVFDFTELTPPQSQYNKVLQGGGVQHRSFVTPPNTAGQVAGESGIINSTTAHGIDDWLFSNGTFTIVNPNTGIYQTTNNGTRDGTVVALNNVGQVIGHSDFYNSSNQQNGQDAWLYTGTQTIPIGLDTGIYQTSSPNSGGGLARDSIPAAINDNGQVVGSSGFYNSVGTETGSDAWIYSNGVSTQIGLTDGTHQVAYTGAGGGFVRSSSALLINNAGQVAGISDNFNSSGTGTGYDAWLYNGSTTVQIGLTGPNYTGVVFGGRPLALPLYLNNTGQVAGTSLYFGSNGVGQDVWLYSNGSTHQMGFTGGIYETTTPQASGNVRYSTVVGLNNKGAAIGTSAIYDPTGQGSGQDAWLYQNNTNTQLGFTTGQFQTTNGNGGIVRFSNPVQINDAGQVIGTSNYYSSNGFKIGTVSWLYNGGTTTQIGLTSGIYQAANPNPGGGIVTDDTVGEITDNGLILGSSARYDSSGQQDGTDGWLYNSKTNTTDTITSGIVDPINGSETDPAFVTDAGVVVGYYKTLTDFKIDTYNLFWWDEADGFHDLGALTNGGFPLPGSDQFEDFNLLGVAGNGFSSLSNPFAIVNGAPLEQNERVSDNFILTVVPEPAAVAPLALCMLLLVRKPKIASK